MNALRLIYRATLFACPRDVRRERGREMEEMFLFCVTTAASRGSVAGIRATARGLGDAIAFAASARWGAARPFHPTSVHRARRARSPFMRLQDLRLAVRFLRHQPGLAAAIVLMLGLGMGATTALFSVVYGVLLEPIPFPHPEELVSLVGTKPDRGWSRLTFTEANFWDVAAMNHSFSALGASHSAAAILVDGTEPERVDVSIVNAGFLRALAVAPRLGRLFTDEDERPGALGVARPVILSEDLWRRRYGADPAVVGRTVQLGTGSRTIVGVLPRDQPILGGEQMFVPFVHRPDPDRGSYEYTVIGRLKPGVTMQAARADLAAVSVALAREYPVNVGLGILLESSDTWVADDGLRRTLWILLGSVGLLLVIACVNVTNLLLARASARARESAIRTAMGASRADLVRESLAESLALSGIAMGVGLAIAEGLLHLARSYATADLPRLANATVNGWVFAFACAIALVVGVATGLVPAWQAPVADVLPVLRHGQRGAVGDARQDALRRIFVAAEVALSLVLLVGAGLLVRSLARVLTADRGFQTDHRLLANVTFPGGYAPATLARLNVDMLRHLAALPQVESASLVSAPPLEGGSSGLGFAAGDRADDSGGSVPWATWRLISPSYFDTMGVPVIAGRTFEVGEPATPMRTIISQRVADLLWPSENAVGRTIILWKGQGDNRAEVIGVVGNMRERALDSDPTLAVYLPMSPTAGMASAELVVRTRVAADAAVRDVRAAVRSVDSRAPLSNIRSLDAVVDASVGPRRFAVQLLGAFAGLALLLALAGVGAVLAYTVARRIPEIGLRLALGAGHRRLLRFTIAQGMLPVVAGLALGLGAMFWLARLMSTLLFGVTAGDPVTYIAAGLAILGTTFVACYLPARRVLRVDPAVSLRMD